MKILYNLILCLLWTQVSWAQFFGGPFGDPDQGDIDAGKHSFICSELDATPANPAANGIKFYCKDNGSGSTKLYTLDELGSEVEIGSGSGSGSGTVGIGTFTSGTAGRIPIYIAATTIGSPHNNVMDANGNLGINTSAPLQALDVNGTVRITNSALLMNTNDSTAIAGTVYFGVNLSTPTNTAIGVNGSSGNGTSTGMFFPNRDMVAFSTKQIERMRIDNNNIGIGTSSPWSKLTVNGGIGIGTTLTNDAYLRRNAAPSGGLIVQGNVGIGTFNPYLKICSHNGNLSFELSLSFTP